MQSLGLLGSGGWLCALDIGTFPALAMAVRPDVYKLIWYEVFKFSCVLGYSWLPMAYVSSLHSEHFRDQALDTPIESLGTTQLGDRSDREKMERLDKSIQFCPH